MGPGDPGLRRGRQARDDREGASSSLHLRFVIPALVAGIAWERLRIALASDAAAPELALSLGLFVALWLSALLLSGAAATLRSFAWTAETYRPVEAAEPVLDPRTIGDPRAGRPGEWPTTGASGSL